MAFPTRSFVRMSAAITAATVVLSDNPSAVADTPGCLPLNGTQLTANSHENTNYFGITYETNVTY